MRFLLLQALFHGYWTLSEHIFAAKGHPRVYYAALSK